MAVASTLPGQLVAVAALLALSVAMTASASASPAPANRSRRCYKHLFSFGDSLIDTGNSMVNSTPPGPVLKLPTPPKISSAAGRPRKSSAASRPRNQVPPSVPEIKRRRPLGRG
uniref:GDSL esterase/lipase n=1 Tax=Aegilops tauschii TaxID=37682 RepID=M8B529_AEGTA